MNEKRKGARSAKDIPEEILAQLNQGTLETVNLTEWLAVDQKVLLANLLKQTGRSAYLPPVLENIDALKKTDGQHHQRSCRNGNSPSGIAK